MSKGRWGGSCRRMRRGADSREEEGIFTWSDWICPGSGASWSGKTVQKRLGLANCLVRGVHDSPHQLRAKELAVGNDPK